jgi:hypothetical protein
MASAVRLAAVFQRDLFLGVEVALKDAEQDELPDMQDEAARDRRR